MNEMHSHRSLWTAIHELNYAIGQVEREFVKLDGTPALNRVLHSLESSVRSITKNGETLFGLTWKADW